MLIYKAKVNKAHIKIINKAIDILKSVARGELNTCAGLISENKIPHISNNIEIEEIFTSRIRKLKNALIDIENSLLTKYITILQMGEFGIKLSLTKSKLIKYGYSLNSLKKDYIEINLTSDDLSIIHLACSLYWNVLSGNILFLLDLFSDSLIDKSVLNDKLLGVQDLCNPYVDNLNISINDKILNRKAKWCFDICSGIDNIGNTDYYQYGTLQKIVYKENG